MRRMNGRGRGRTGRLRGAAWLQLHCLRVAVRWNWMCQAVASDAVRVRLVCEVKPDDSSRLNPLGVYRISRDSSAPNRLARLCATSCEYQRPGNFCHTHFDHPYQSLGRWPRSGRGTIGKNMVPHSPRVTRRGHLSARQPPRPNHPQSFQNDPSSTPTRCA